MIRHLLFLLCLLFCIIGNAQVLIQGKVFDISKKALLESVAVLTNTGKGTITDSTGTFSLNVRETDTIFFSYMGKNTNRFAVKDITERLNFNISIHVVSNELPGVTVRSRNYLIDSIQNRKDYAKVFNYRKPTLSLVTNRNYTPGGMGASFDLEAIINMFRFKHNRQILSLQRRLVQQEQDKYIDKRFNKWFVTRLTKLQGAALDSFMVFYRPSFEFLTGINDIELGVYIEASFKHYERVKRGELLLPPRQDLY